MRNLIPTALFAAVLGYQAARPRPQKEKEGAA